VENQPASLSVHGAGRDHRLRALIDSIFDAYYDWDIKVGPLEFSAQLGTFLGIDPSTLNNIPAWAERIHPDDREEALAKLDRCVSEGCFYDAAYRMRRADGSYAVVRDRGVTLLDDSGAAAHLVGVIRDVTREREAEEALIESAELYHTLFELAVNPAFHVDQDGRYVNSNVAGLSFLESSLGDLVGESVATHWGTEVLGRVLSVLADGDAAVRLDAEVQVAGSTKAAILTLVPCRIGGQQACFVLATDITDRQTLARALEESNIALRVILEQRDRAREELERTIAANVESIVLPHLERLTARLAGAPEAAFLDTAMRNLREIVRPFGPVLADQEGARLTRREREIADLIRAGKSTVEIAQAFYISPETVAFHRKNLRKKLGLEGQQTRLSSYLNGAPPSGLPGRGPTR
jgi:PAS domain S-box-containing protein